MPIRIDPQLFLPILQHFIAFPGLCTRAPYLGGEEGWICFPQPPPILQLPPSSIYTPIQPELRWMCVPSLIGAITPLPSDRCLLRTSEHIGIHVWLNVFFYTNCMQWNKFTSVVFISYLGCCRYQCPPKTLCNVPRLVIRVSHHVFSLKDFPLEPKHVSFSVIMILHSTQIQINCLRCTICLKRWILESALVLFLS